MYHLNSIFLQKNLNKIYKRTIYDIRSVGPLLSNPNKRPIQCNLTDIDKLLHNNMKISVGIAGGTAVPLVNYITKTSIDKKLKNIEFMHLLTSGSVPYTKQEYNNTFSTRCFYLGQNMRKPVKEGNADFCPIFFSDIPKLYREKIIPIDICLANLSVENSKGYCSLGVSCGETRAAIESAKIVIGMINKKMPYTYGDSEIHISNIDYLVNIDDDIEEVKLPEITPESRIIAKYISEKLIEDKSTIQIGVGSVIMALMENLYSFKDIGIHTEVFSDGLIPLYNKGIITGKYKNVDNGLITTTFVKGSKAIYDFVDKNKDVIVRDVAFTNNPFVISNNYHTISINSAIEIDLTGQVVSDSIGSYIYSGTGGQVDFVYGSSLCPEGKSIIAMSSCTNKGKSKIVSNLTKGAGVVTTRANVRYVVTEYGIVDLFGKSISERAKLLISISHPSQRSILYNEAYEKGIIV